MARLGCSDQCNDARLVDIVDLSQLAHSLLFRQCARPTERFVRMLVEDPQAELPTDFVLADTFDHRDTSVAQDANPFAVNTRMWVAHANDDSSDPAIGNRARARWCAAVERARLERRVECCASDTLAASLSVAGSSDLRVIFAGAQGVTESQELASEIHDRTTDPWVTSRRPARKFRFFNREPHPLLMVLGHSPSSYGTRSSLILTRIRLGAALTKRGAPPLKHVSRDAT